MFSVETMVPKTREIMRYFVQQTACPPRKHTKSLGTAAVAGAVLGTDTCKPVCAIRILAIGNTHLFGP